MPRFKILEGLFDGGNGAGEAGRRYGKGEVIETDLDLDEMFANKFKRLTGRTRSSRDHDDLPDEGGGTKVMDSKRRLEKRIAAQQKSGPGPGQSQDEFDEEMEKENFIDVSPAAGAGKKMKGAEPKKGKKALTTRRFSDDHDEEVVEEAEFGDDEETTEDDEDTAEIEDEAGDESASEEETPEPAETESEDAEEEEEKPKKKKSDKPKAGMNKKKK